MDRQSIEGKVAVVLGASAERGIGWAVAAALASAGAKVVVGARSIVPLTKLADQIGGVAVRCDAGREEDIVNIVNETMRIYGRLDIAVNLAVSQESGLVQDFELEKLRQVMDVNIIGNANFLKHVSIAMGERKRGEEASIVLMSSICSTHPMLSLFPYGTSKAAIDGMVRYAAQELGSKGIKVNSIQPGAIMSELSAPVYGQPAVARLFENEIPMGRIGDPADVADAVLWLTSGAYATGINLQLSGGMQLGRFPYAHEMPAGGMDSFEVAKAPSER